MFISSKYLCFIHFNDFKILGNTTFSVLVDGQLGCSHFLSIVKSATINACVQFLLAHLFSLHTCCSIVSPWKARIFLRQVISQQVHGSNCRSVQYAVRHRGLR